MKSTHTSCLVVLIVFGLLSSSCIGNTGIKVPDDIKVGVKANIEATVVAQVDDKTLKSLDKAIDGIRAAPADWKSVINQLDVELSNIAKEAEETSKDVADQIKDVSDGIKVNIKEATAFADAVAMCATDFLGARILENLSAIRATLTGDPAPIITPSVCVFIPQNQLELTDNAGIRTAKTSTIEVHGYNFSEDNLPEIVLVNKDNGKVIRTLDRQPNFSSKYLIQLDLQGIDFSDLNEGSAIGVRWEKNGGGNLINDLPIIIPTPIPTATPIPVYRCDLVIDQFQVTNPVIYGNAAQATITVRNAGEEACSGFTVRWRADGSFPLEENVNDGLNPGDQRTFQLAYNQFTQENRTYESIVEIMSNQQLPEQDTSNNLATFFFSVQVPAPRTVTYEILVKTGDVNKAGADEENAFLRLQGTKGESDEINLSTPGTDNLERGDLDRFYFNSSPSDLGDITSIKIRYQDDEGWLLESVNVRNTETNQEWFFPCNKWLDSDSEGNHTQRTLYYDHCD